MFALNAIFAASSEMPNSTFKNLFALPALVLVPIQLKKTSLPFQAVSALKDHSCYQSIFHLIFCYFFYQFKRPSANRGYFDTFIIR